MSHRGETDSDWFHRYVGTTPEREPAFYLEETGNPARPIKGLHLRGSNFTISRAQAEDLAQWILDTLAETPPR